MVQRVHLVGLRAVLLAMRSFFFLPSLLGLTIEDLRNDPDLTPERFAEHFANFKFQFRAQIQSPETFLATKSGDCDDFATLAADILRRKGYTPHMITVRTKKVVHVVCYIEETKAYLDFEKRKHPNRLVGASHSLAEIAQKVAESFNAQWTSVSEFTYEAGVKRLVSTVSRHNALAANQAEVKIASVTPAAN